MTKEYFDKTIILQNNNFTNEYFSALRDSMPLPLGPVGGNFAQVTGESGTMTVVSRYFKEKNAFSKESLHNRIPLKKYFYRKIFCKRIF